MSGLGILAPILPILMLASLVFAALRRRREKKKRFEGPNGRT